MRPGSAGRFLCSRIKGASIQRCAVMGAGFCVGRSGKALGPKIRVPRPDATGEVRRRIQAGGAAKLRVIFDFDHTLTRFIREDGQPAPMCHDTVERSPLMPEAFRVGYRQLWADQLVANGEGATWPNGEWWERSHGLMIEHGLREDWLPTIARDGGLRLRQGCQELIALLAAHGVPVLVVSAGITQLIEHVLSAGGVRSDCVRVRANRMRFDQDGVLRGFEPPTLHGYAKREVADAERAYLSESPHRPHVVVVGDGLRDCEPLVGVEGVDAALRVGFFNARTKAAQLAQYEETFDILLSNEGIEPPEDLTLAPLADILSEIVTGGPLSPCSPTS